MFVTGTGGNVTTYSLSSPFDASTASFVHSLNVSAQESDPRDVAFSSDGARMFVVGAAGDAVSEYSLSPPFDASTATFVDATSVSAQNSFPTGMAFSSDGARMFVTGVVASNVNEYSLSSPFDASTASFVHSLDVSAQESGPSGMAFSSDGARMFVVGSGGDAVHDTPCRPRLTHPLPPSSIPSTSRRRIPSRRAWRFQATAPGCS